MECHYPDAGSSAIFGRDADAEMGFEMGHHCAFINPQPTHDISHDQSSIGHSSTDYPMHFSGDWSAMDVQYQNHPSHQRHTSASTQSSLSSNIRSSDDSIFSQWRVRDSIASTNTALSHNSEPPRDYYISQTERSLGFDPTIEYQPTPSPIEESPQPPPKKRVSQRQPAPEKEPFATCVSRTKRSRRSNKEPRYWCTSCKEPFVEKYDWKRHEETYQERREKFECDLCKNIYFLDKDFIHHHQKGHRCKTCVENQHVECARQERRSRTGWGCGFCNHFDFDWTERCNHIARHFERDGKTMEDWKHSQVILSLLQRPEIRSEWDHLLESRRRLNPRFGWNKHATGRVEGYPESNPNAQLQDLLEYFEPNQDTPDQDAALIARWAFEKGLLQKELPRPPVPPKDHRSYHSTTLQDVTNDDMQWTRMLNAIPEDDLSPTGVIDIDTLNQAIYQYH